jgi:hypothetical protein
MAGFAGEDGGGSAVAIIAGFAAGEDGGSAVAIIAGLGFELAHPARQTAVEVDAPVISKRRVRINI